MRTILLLAIIFSFFALPRVALAQDYYNIHKAPPQLDNQQANWWRYSTPHMRQYLARLYEVPIDDAQMYGAYYDNENTISSPINPETYIEEVGTIASVDNRPITIVTVQYNAPPGLPDALIVSWATADPKFKVHLAEVYGIPKDIAILYGAEY